MRTASLPADRMRKRPFVQTYRRPVRSRYSVRERSCRKRQDGIFPPDTGMSAGGSSHGRAVAAEHHNGN